MTINCDSITIYYRVLSGDHIRAVTWLRCVIKLCAWEITACVGTRKLPLLSHLRLIKINNCCALVIMLLLWLSFPPDNNIYRGQWILMAYSRYMMVVANYNIRRFLIVTQNYTVSMTTLVAEDRYRDGVWL